MAPTSGPWIATRWTCHAPTTIKAGERVVAECATAFDGENGRDTDNARLIAAAPDMLAALQRSLDWLSSYPGGLSLECYDQARAAIAKATEIQQQGAEK